jgi:hypothetical protein
MEKLLWWLFCMQCYIYLLEFWRWGFLLEKVDPLRLDLRRVDCWQVALNARTDEPLHLLE